MAKMSGEVDSERRPLLRLTVPDGTAILSLIDTGFNGALGAGDHDAEFQQAACDLATHNLTPASMGRCLFVARRCR